MSYPFTKPTPRYGFRRRWNDPRGYLIGSGGPVSYPSTAERYVRATGLGSEFTPDTAGIFDQRIPPGRGMARGVFRADPPWSLPGYLKGSWSRYGLGGCGPLGQDNGGATCGLEALKAMIVTKIMETHPFSQIPNVKVSDPSGLIGADLDIRGAVATAIGTALSPVISALAGAIKQGTAAVKTFFIQNVSKQLAISVGGVGGAEAYLDFSGLANIFINLADSVAALVEECSKAPFVSPICACHDQGKILLEGTGECINPADCELSWAAGRCRKGPGDLGVPVAACKKRKPTKTITLLAAQLPGLEICKTNPGHPACAEALRKKLTITQLKSTTSKTTTAGGAGGNALLPILAIAAGALLLTRVM